MQKSFELFPKQRAGGVAVFGRLCDAKKSGFRRNLLACGVLALLGSLAGSAQAADYVGGNNGDYNLAANWLPADVPDTPAETANFPAFATALTVNITANVSPGSVTVAAGGDYILTGVGVISGTGTVTSSGQLAFTNTNPHTYTGATNIGAGGFVRIGNNTANGAIAAASNVVNNGTLFLSRSDASYFFPNVISGSGGVTKTNATGGVTIQGSNTYTGPTRVSEGRYSVDFSSRLGAITAPFIFDGGFLVVNGTAFPNFGARPVTFSSGKLVGIEVNTANATFTISQKMDQGTGGFTKGGNALTTGRVVLSGDNTFTGGVLINAGIVTITNSSALGLGTKTININNGSSGDNQLHLDGTLGAITLPATFTYVTSNATSGSLHNIIGNNTIQGVINPFSGGGDTIIVSNAGNLTVTAPITPTTTGRNLRVRGNGNVEISGAISNGAAGFSPFAVMKESGTGTLILSGTNTYVGATTLAAGTLLVNGSIANSATTVTGGTLGGTGTFAAVTQTASRNSIVAPGPMGAAVGTLSTNAVNLNTGNFFNVDLASATSTDKLIVTGAVGLNNVTLRVNLGFVPSDNDTPFTIIENDLADPVNGTFIGLPEGSRVFASFGGATYAFVVSYVGGGDTGAGTGNDVTLTNVNQKPEFQFQVGPTNPGTATPQRRNINEDTPLVFAFANNLGIQIVDSDVGTAPLQVALTSTNGILTLSATNNVTVTGNGTSAITISGSLADINTALNNLRFDPTAEFSGEATIVLNVSDGGNGNGSSVATDTETQFITVNSVNDAPDLTNIEVGNLVYTEGAPATQITNSLRVVDRDNGTLASATVTITSASFVSGQDVLEFNPPASITGVLNAVGNMVTFSGAGGVPASVTDFQAALRSVTFRNSSPNPDTRTRVVNFQANDGGNVNPLSNIATRSIDVKSVNGLPTLAAITPNPLELQEDAGPQTVNLTGIGDGDGGLQVVTITATSSNPAIVPNPTVNYTNPATTGTLTLTPVANAFGSVTITVRVTDNFSPAAFIEQTFVVNITANNDAPVISDIADMTIAEDTSTGPISFTISDVETLPGALTVTPSSSNTAVVPNANISIGGSDGDRTITVTPLANINGTATITVSVSDVNTTTTETFLVTVTPVNDAPNDIALSNSFVPENATIGDSVGTFTTSDVDVNDTVFAYTLVTGTGDTDNALFDINGNTLETAQALDFETRPTLSIRVRSTDAAGLFFEKVFTITVTDVSEPPVLATNQILTLNEGATAIITNQQLAATDPDNPQDLTFIVRTLPANGTLRKNGAALAVGGSFTQADINNNLISYLNNGSEASSDSFNFDLFDTFTIVGPNTFNIAITPVNDAPVATPQSVIVTEDTPRTITLAAIDSDSSNFTFTIVTQPTNGTISGGTGATRTYTPNLNFVGMDSFTFRARDNALNSEPATVNITITPINDAPVATPQNVDVIEDTPRSITLGATDEESTNFSFTIVTQPTNGTISGGTGATRTYTPNANFNGRDSFSFVANDGTSDSEPAIVGITVTPVNDAPVALTQDVTVIEDTPRSITLGATDEESTNLTYTIVTQPTRGTISGGTGNVRTYTPNDDSTEGDTFTFKASDGARESNVAAVNITITAVNDAPVAVPDVATTDEDTSVLIDVIRNDRDEARTGLTVQAVTPNSQTKGLVSIVNNQVRFGPAFNFSGTTSFSYTISDGTFSSTSTVTVQVVAVNDIPIAQPDRYATAGRVLKVIPAEGVLVNDTDIDGDTLNARVVDSPLKGTLVLEQKGGFTYTPFPSVGGFDSFTYVASDGKDDSRKILVQMTVGAARDVRAPEIVIASPKNGAVLRAFGRIEGITSDGPGDRRTGAITPSGVNRVEVFIVRSSDNFFFNGGRFQATRQTLRATLDGRTWRLNVPSLSGVVLVPGRYQIVATSVDNAGNRGRAQSFVRIESSLTPTDAAPASRVALSSAAASAAQSSVRLQFTGAMSASTQAEQFTVSVNGTLAEVESVSVAGNVITLGLSASTCKTDDAVEVQWNNLQDVRKATLRDDSRTLTAR